MTNAEWIAFGGLIVGIVGTLGGLYLSGYISKPDALKQQTVSDRDNLQRQLNDLRNAMTQHFEVCNETPNSLILSEISHTRKSLESHAESDKEVSERIHTELSTIRSEQKDVTRELNQEMKAQRMAIEALTIGQETLKIMLQNAVSKGN